MNKTFKHYLSKCDTQLETFQRDFYGFFLVKSNECERKINSSKTRV